MNHKITEYLRNANSLTFVIYGMLVAFCTYSCMYAFRKPIMAATFDEQMYWGIDYKVLIITSQVIGYTLSKFIGIKVVSELGGNKRAIAILTLIGISALGLFFFAITPAPYNLFFIFINGLPLGMVWGLVFNYLEGRTTTELLGVGLAVTQIFSSGFVKTIGSSLLIYVDVPEVWMPFVTGMIFMIPLLFFVWLLNLIPAPSERDIALRTARRPMNGKERWNFFVTFMPGLVMLVATYTFLTVYRDFRDNFSADIWKSLGYGKNALIFTQTEIPIFLIVMLAIGAMVMVKNNYAAFFINHWFVIFGVSLVGILTRLFEMGYLSPEVWMSGIGLGLYLAYTTFGLMIFERLMSTFKYLGTVGFIMYLADSSGYLGSVVILFYKNFAHPHIAWTDFFISMSYWLSGTCITMMLISMAYFQYKYAQNVKQNFALEAQVS
ncbi:MAG: DUF5690 family protein [Microscillaceae bacterium]|nr:DUF5690 family protein [Microscillaceae bacterium]